MHTKIDISIIIVSYNVRAFLIHCLESVVRAGARLRTEIIVVDNASADGSAAAVRKKFPEVQVIQNSKNRGFSAANNQAIREARGRHVLLLNPDTVVEEDTFTSLIDYMDEHPHAGAITCKILNPDGRFSIDSRHSIPSPLTAFWKLIGLDRLFPKSKVFGRYNLTFLDENETHEVDAISGSFMLIRQKTIEEVGLLDESFFMYCEDIDYCYRITQAGWKIIYYPVSQIIHYKGESTKKSNIDYVINFNKSLYLFYKKHFHQRYIRFFGLLIIAGVILRGSFIYIKNLVRKHAPALADLVLLNLILIFGFYWRYEWASTFYWDDYFNQYIWINIIASFLFVGTALMLELYQKYTYSIVQVVKVNLLTFAILAALTFFLRQLAFSRIIVIAVSVFGSLSMVGWRIILRLIQSPQGKTFSKTLFQKKTLLVGQEKQVETVLKKLRTHVMSNIDVTAVRLLDDANSKTEFYGLPVISKEMDEYVRIEKIDQVIFASYMIPFKHIMQIITNSRFPGVEFKMIPEKLDVIIGKSRIQDLETYPLLDIDYKIGKYSNRMFKRLFDILLASGILIITLPVWIFNWIFRKHHSAEIWDKNGQRRRIIYYGRNANQGISNFLVAVGYILTGLMSFVGSPLAIIPDKKPSFFYRPGITGLVQINAYKIRSGEEREMYELYYIKNQNIWLDLEIILKAIISQFRSK